jgi:hypothetical protein
MSTPGRTRGKPTTPPPRASRREGRVDPAPDRGESVRTSRHRDLGDRLVHDRVRDEDLLLGGEEALQERPIAGREPADPDAG